MESFHGGKIYIMIIASVGKPNSCLSISHWRSATDSFEAFPILSFSTFFQNWASYPDFLFDYLWKKSELKDYYLTIRPAARKGLWRNSPWGEAEWAIDPWPLRAKGLIVLVSPN